LAIAKINGSGKDVMPASLRAEGEAIYKTNRLLRFAITNNDG